MMIADTLLSARRRGVVYTDELGGKIDAGRCFFLDVLDLYSQTTGDDRLDLVVDLAVICVKTGLA